MTFAYSDAIMMKNIVLASLLVAAGCGQAKNPVEDLSELAGIDVKSASFSRRMLLVGSLSYGETSADVQYRNPPRYRAFKFGGQKGDKVDIHVRSTNGGDSVAWLTNNAFSVIASNDDSDGTLDSHIQATLP